MSWEPHFPRKIMENPKSPGQICIFVKADLLWPFGLSAEFLGEMMVKSRCCAKLRRQFSHWTCKICNITYPANHSVATLPCINSFNPFLLLRACRVCNAASLEDDVDRHFALRPVLPELNPLDLMFDHESWWVMYLEVSPTGGWCWLTSFKPAIFMGQPQLLSDIKLRVCVWFGGQAMFDNDVWMCLMLLLCSCWWSLVLNDQGRIWYWEARACEWEEATAQTDPPYFRSRALAKNQCLPQISEEIL